MTSTSRDTQETELGGPDVPVAGDDGAGSSGTGGLADGAPHAGGHGTGGRDDGSHPASAPLHHTRVGRYVLLSRLGRGGMGEVFEAFDPELRRTVAIKVLHERRLPNETRDTRALRLMREAQAMARLSHPNVLTVHDVGTHEGRVFLAMAKVDGGTLRQWLKKGSRSFRQVLPVCLSMGRGLAAAHAAGLVHRDFKPDNVLLGSEGGVWVTDFGIARESDAAEEPTAAEALIPGEGEAPLTATGAMVGTPAYMAPEQYAGRPADARSDQFSYCVSVYEALAGRRPFEEGTLRRMAVTLLDTVRAKEGAVVAERPELAPPPHPNVPGWVHRLLVRGLSVSPESRFSSMDALLDALGKDPAAGRRKLLGGAAVVLGGAALAAGVAVTVSKPQAQPCTGAPALFRPRLGPFAAHRRGEGLHRQRRAGRGRGLHPGGEGVGCLLHPVEHHAPAGVRGYACQRCAARGAPRAAHGLPGPAPARRGRAHRRADASGRGPGEAQLRGRGRAPRRVRLRQRGGAGLTRARRG
ncbi:serine/threonine-protein kinase [Pyxidicoccus sp. 3LG]